MNLTADADDAAVATSNNVQMVCSVLLRLRVRLALLWRFIPFTNTTDSFLHYMVRNGKEEIEKTDRID